MAGCLDFTLVSCVVQMGQKKTPKGKPGHPSASRRPVCKVDVAVGGRARQVESRGDCEHLLDPAEGPRAVPRVWWPRGARGYLALVLINSVKVQLSVMSPVL